MSEIVLNNVASGIAEPIVATGAGPQITCTAGSADLKEGNDVVISLAAGDWTNLDSFAGGTSLTIEATAAGTTVKRVG